jgi:hypothetical protein
MLQGPELGKLFADHFVIVHLTVQESDDKKQLENPGAEQLLAREGAGKSGVPVFMFEIRCQPAVAGNLRFNLGETSSSRLQPHPSRCRAAPLESHQEVEMKNKSRVSPARDQLTCDEKNLRRPSRYRI